MSKIEIVGKESGEISYSCDHCGEPHEKLIFLGNARIDLCHNCYIKLGTEIINDVVETIEKIIEK